MTTLSDFCDDLTEEQPENVTYTLITQCKDPQSAARAIANARKECNYKYPVICGLDPKGTGLYNVLYEIPMEKKKP